MSGSLWEAALLVPHCPSHPYAPSATHLEAVGEEEAVEVRECGDGGAELLVCEHRSPMNHEGGEPCELGGVLQEAPVLQRRRIPRQDEVLQHGEPQIPVYTAS